MLHYTPQHVSSSTLLIIRRTNCITTASGIVTLCKQPYSMQAESGLFHHTLLITKMFRSLLLVREHVWYMCTGYFIYISLNIL